VAAAEEYASPSSSATARASAEENDGIVGEARARVASALGGSEFIPTLLTAAGFLAVAAALVDWLPADGGSAGVLVTVSLVGAYAIAARVQFEAGFGMAVPTQLVFVPMLFLAPLRLVPLLVVLGFLLSTLPELIRGEWNLGRALAVHCVSGWHAVGPVAVLAVAGVTEPSLQALPFVALALVAQFTLDFASSGWRGLALGMPPQQLVQTCGPAWLVDAALTPIGLALAYVCVDEPYAFLLAFPLMGLLAYFARERKARIDHALELSHAYRGTAFLLGDMVEADDAYTGLHSQDVVSLVLAVADELGLDGRERREAEFTALLHDVGKVKIPKEIINKPGKLTPEEREIINMHTIEGELMLEKIGGLLGDVGRLVRSCHEHWDGAGYPDRIAGERIPLVARIVCACDAFSAMTTNRSYREAMSQAEAIEEMQRCAGTQFDPRVVDALVRVADVERPAALAAAA
jgi:HD-GYP domain-containing protein (c-di-GMP phosphodiesterase class II)